MTYQQEQNERNDIIESDDENQTVINCTQSDMDTSEDHTQQEERISDKNIIADEFSLEYENHKYASNSSEEVAEMSIHQEDHSEIREQQVFSYNEDTSEYDEGEEDEMLSRVEFPLDTEQHETYNTQSDGGLIKEIEAEDIYQDKPSANTRKQFESTLTNMRLAFGSEQQVRENSVKTLEKMAESTDKSQSAKKTDEQCSIFEKKSFQDFSLKKFTELMQVKNMKNFQTSMQKTFREYNRSKSLLTSDKKDENNKTTSTPKKAKYISPRKCSMRDLELDRIGYEKMKENSAKKEKFVNEIMGSSSSQNKSNGYIYRNNLSIEK